MKGIINATKVAYASLFVSQGIIAQIFLIMLLVIFDGASNSFSIAQLFGERMILHVKGIYPELTEIEQTTKASNISIWFSILASSALGLGIFVLSLIGNQATQRASDRLAWISFFISFIGFIMFITPDDVTFSNLHQILTVKYVIQLIFCGIISSFSPYLTSILSRNLAITNRERFKQFQDKIVSSVEDMMTGEIKQETKLNEGTTGINVREFLKAS